MKNVFHLNAVLAKSKSSQFREHRIFQEIQISAQSCHPVMGSPLMAPSRIIVTRLLGVPDIAEYNFKR